MKTTRQWKVYGADGHRQRLSFGASTKWDFSSEEVGARVIEILSEDVTATNEYCILKITRNTVEECEEELNAQLSDGAFKNSRFGKIEEIQ